jgi:hypothetical protein
MKVIRETPEAVNKPMLMLGVDRMLFGADIAIATLLAREGHEYFATVLFFGIFFAARHFLKGDPNALSIFVECWKFKPVSDPILRKPFEMELGE